ncbi:MAG: F0F1 ATP synthase subunit epsilon [Gammaproteobacteria bacterium]|mgnify:FL=1|jgi:F-type H+-transporting ATPase subunit epsilon|nr:MAG: F0F1 ATP synthase subunit epsilon [Gammaproteobacteria bacterium]
MSTILCSIVSAEKEIFSEDVAMVVATGTMGELGITPGHTQLLTGIKPGPVKVVKENGEEEVFFLSGGFIEVQPDTITLLSDVAIRAEDIDEEQAEKAREQAEKIRDNADSDLDFSRARAELAEAAARLQTLRKMRKK